MRYDNESLNNLSITPLMSIGPVIIELTGRQQIYQGLKTASGLSTVIKNVYNLTRYWYLNVKKSEQTLKNAVYRKEFVEFAEFLECKKTGPQFNPNSLECKTKFLKQLPAENLVTTIK